MNLFAHNILTKVLSIFILAFIVEGCGGESNHSGGTSSNDYSDLDNGPKKKKKSKNRKTQTFNLPKIVLTQKNAKEELAKYAEENPENMVMIYTRMGNLKLKLYKETPLHRANFIRMTKIKYFDRTLFHRVVKDFMIQGGGGGGLHRIRLKKAIGSYRVPHEIKPQQFFHKRGALATARIYENNPEKRSNPYNFYIVQSKTKYNAPTLRNMEKKQKITFGQAQIQTYGALGGVPSLDGLHTVFGELVEGFEVMDKIAAVKTKKTEWPVKDIYIDSVRVIK